MKHKEGKLFTDQIVKVFLKTGEKKWILIHIEVQGKTEINFYKRMLQYFYRIYDHFDHEVYAIALITDQPHTKQADGFHYSYHGTKVDYEYNVYRFDPKNIDELKQSDNPFAAAVIAGIYAHQAKNDVEKRYKFKRQLMIQILQKYSKQQENTRTYLSALFYFIDYILQVPADFTKQLTKEITPYLGEEVIQQMKAEKTNPSQTLEEIFAELRKEGVEEGKEKAREEALSPVIRELVNEGFSNEKIAKITKLTVDEVTEWR